MDLLRTIYEVDRLNQEEAIRKELDVRRLYRLLAPCPLLAGYIIIPNV